MRALWTFASILALSAPLAACKKKDGEGVDEGAAAPAGEGRARDRRRGDRPRNSSCSPAPSSPTSAPRSPPTRGQGPQRAWSSAASASRWARRWSSSTCSPRRCGAREAQANLGVGAGAAAARRAGVQAHASRCSTRARSRAASTTARSRSARRRCSRSSAAEARAQMMTKSVADGIVRAPFEGDGRREERLARRVGRARPPAVHAGRRRSAARSSCRCPRPRSASIQKGQEVELTAVAHPDKKYQRDGHAGRRRDRPHALADRRGDARARLGAGPRHVRRGAGHGRPDRRARWCRRPRSSSAARRWHVFVVEERRGRGPHRPGRRRPPDADKVSIVQGVDKGDKVVAKVTDQIVDGRRVVE